MSPAVAKLCVNLKTENEQLKKEVTELKKRLQHRHTEIFDLRASKRALETHYKSQVSQ